MRPEVRKEMKEYMRELVDKREARIQELMESMTIESIRRSLDGLEWQISHYQDVIKRMVEEIRTKPDSVFTAMIGDVDRVDFVVDDGDFIERLLAEQALFEEALYEKKATILSDVLNVGVDFDVVELETGAGVTDQSPETESVATIHLNGDDVYRVFESARVAMGPELEDDDIGNEPEPLKSDENETVGEEEMDGGPVIP